MSYYVLLENLDKILRIAASKLLDLGNGLIYKLIAIPPKGRQLCWFYIGKLSKDHVQQVLSMANDVCSGHLIILNNTIRIKGQLEWSKDYFSGFIWPQGIYYRKYNQVNPKDRADVKVPRELSRFHFSLTLGIAFDATGSHQYYDCFKRLVLSWIDENPFLFSINWCCTQDIAIRAVNWIWTANLFKDKLVLDSEFYYKLVKTLYEHGVYVYYHPEKRSYNNHNHYIGDLVGQIYLGLTFQYDKQGREWLAWGMKELFREMRYQILPSGPSYEKSTNYHRFVTEMCLSAIILLDKAGYEIPADISYRLDKMLEFIMYYTKPDGTAPVIGDQDDARLHPFSLRNNLEHTSLLALGAVMFNRSDFKAISNSSCLDGILLFGNEFEQHYNNIPDIKPEFNSMCYPDAGFYIIRHQNDYMFINNSGKSKNSELGGGTHTHSDLLSFELFIEDKSFLVDPGSYIYSADPDARMLFRSTPMHNTVVVDGQSQNILNRENLWDFERSAIPKTNLWIDNIQKTIFEGEHSGYQRLPLPIIHKRRIEYDKENRNWLIEDKLEGEGKHCIEVYFHFDAGIPLIYEKGILRTECEEGMNIELSYSSPVKLEGLIEDGWVSKAYSQRDRAKVFKLSCEAMCPLQIKTKIQRSLK